MWVDQPCRLGGPEGEQVGYITRPISGKPEVGMES